MAIQDTKDPNYTGQIAYQSFNPTPKGATTQAKIEDVRSSLAGLTGNKEFTLNLLSDMLDAKAKQSSDISEQREKIKERITSRVLTSPDYAGLSPDAARSGLATDVTRDMLEIGELDNLRKEIEDSKNKKIASVEGILKDRISAYSTMLDSLNTQRGQEITISENAKDRALRAAESRMNAPDVKEINGVSMQWDGSKWVPIETTETDFKIPGTADEYIAMLQEKQGQTFTPKYAEEKRKEYDAIKSTSSAFTNALTQASRALSADEYKGLKNTFNKQMSTGDYRGAIDTLTATVQNALPTDIKIYTKLSANKQLSDLKNAFDAYQKAGGKTGKIKGSWEAGFNFFGNTSEPELARLSSDVGSALAAYINSLSGLAVTDRERAFFDDLFPKIDKSYALNTQKIDSLLNNSTEGIYSLYDSMTGGRYSSIAKDMGGTIPNIALPGTYSFGASTSNSSRPPLSDFDQDATIKDTFPSLPNPYK